MQIVFPSVQFVYVSLNAGCNAGKNYSDELRFFQSLFNRVAQSNSKQKTILTCFLFFSFPDIRQLAVQLIKCSDPANLDHILADIDHQGGRVVTAVKVLLV